MKIKLKSGKGFTTPSIFINPQTRQDGIVLREVNDLYPQNDSHDGIRSIDGIVVEIKDWNEVSKGIKLDIPSLIEKRPMNDRVLIIDHGLDFLLRGNESDKNKMAKTEVFEPEIINKINEISLSDSSAVQKSDLVLRNVYPLIDARIIRDLMEFSLSKTRDMLVRPIVPITSLRNIDKQIQKSKQMIKDTKVLLSTVFSKYEGKIDEMNLLTLESSVIEPENYEKICELAITNSPDHIGIRVMNLDAKNESRLRNFLDLQKALYEYMLVNSSVKPIHILNVDTLGFVTYCYGASTITMRLGTDPYYYFKGNRKSTENRPELKGSYYHIQKRVHILYKRLRADTAQAEIPYKLPCYCEACEIFATLLEAEKHYAWNEFRRIHEVLVRNIEINEIRKSPVPLHRAIKDMLARSSTPYATLVPDTPIKNF